MIRALADNYAFNEQSEKLAELETVLRVAAAEVLKARVQIERRRQEPRQLNDDVANPIPVKSEFNRGSGGGTRVIRSGKEMT